MDKNIHFNSINKEKKLDIVTLEVLKNSFPAITNEMSYVLQRTSYNMMIYEVRDYCCGIIDVYGNLISQNIGGVSHFVSDLGAIVKDGIDKYGKEGFRPGDVIITNHQRVAGQHLNNVVIYTPFFFDGELLAFPIVRAHWVDIGGMSTGFSAGNAIDPWMEGFQIDQIKLFEQGELDKKVWQLLKDNIRYPESSLGDLKAQIAACKLAERRLEEIFLKFGIDIIKEAIQRIFDQTEARCRAVVKDIPDGIYEAKSLFGSGLLDEGEPLLIKVKVIIKDSDMIIDLTGCSNQRKSPINARTLAGARVAYKCITTPFDPVNEGSFRALDIIIQEGNYMMAKYPAPMASWGRTIPTVVDTILKALAPVLPNKIPAGHLGVLGGTVVFFGENPGTGQRFVTQSIEGGGWGGRPWEDGESASVSICQGDVCNAPIEKMELKWPVLIEARELRQDSGGPGKFRGGLGVAIRVRNLIEGFWNLSDTGREEYPPWGLWGGKNGVPSCHLLHLSSEKEPKKVNLIRHRVPANSVATILTAGGGGWGDPMERNPEKVLWDVIEGFISLKSAQDEYGVVIDPIKMEIDWEETSFIRNKLKIKKEAHDEESKY